MEEPTHIVYDRPVLEFVTTANKYVTFVEEAGMHDLKSLIDKAHQLLPKLYYQVTLLPAFNSEYEDLNQRFVGEQEYEQVRSRLLMKFGEYDVFEEIFDVNRLEGEDFIGESISENLADIYQDIKDFVLLYEMGTNEIMYEALWELQQSFENFWGQKLVNTLRALHQLRYSSEEIRENEGIQKENANFNMPDTQNWIISRRQEDYRDEE